MLEELQAWYLAQCNGDWEHQSGVLIETLDNPGWRLRIDLKDTALESRAFRAFEETELESNWLVCKVENAVFEAHCGPLMLSTAIGHFLRWADSSEPERPGT